MKINSSSTSFCLYGIRIDAKEEDTVAISAAAKSEGLTWYWDYEQESMWIGRSPETIGDSETGMQFKQSTQEKVKKIIGEDVWCSFYTEECQR